MFACQLTYLESKIINMPIVRFPALMKSYVDNRLEFPVEGATVEELIESLLLQFPALRPHLFDPQGNLRRHFNIFVNGVHIRDLDEMNTLLKENDRIVLMASAAGG